MWMEAQVGLSRCFQQAQVLLLGRWLAAEADAFNTRNAKRAAGVPETEFLAAAAGEAEHLLPPGVSGAHAAGAARVRVC